MVLVLTLPGLLIYVFLRPRETLSEAYERSLEEEALLQEIEEKPVCPGCGQRVQAAWQACPHCHTRLKQPCSRCNKLLELSWNLCPYCATPQRTYVEEDLGIAPVHNHTEPAAEPGQRVSLRRRAARAERDQSLEFIDEDEF
jgi:predicted amidophosphoribosyltransferase